MTLLERRHFSPFDNGPAGLIPRLLDKLSPSGKMPENHVIEEELAKLTKGDLEPV